MKIVPWFLKLNFFKFYFIFKLYIIVLVLPNIKIFMEIIVDVHEVVGFYSPAESRDTGPLICLILAS